LNGAGSSVRGDFTLCVSLITASYLLGFLAEEAKRRNINARVISRLIGNGLPEIGLRATLEGLLHFICDYFDANQVRFVLRRVAGDDAFLWEVSPAGRTREAAVRFTKLSDAERTAYFATLPDAVGRAVQRRRPPDEVGPGAVGASSRYPGSKAGSSRVTGRFRAMHNFGRESAAMRIVGERHTLFVDFRSLLAVSFSYQQNWFGRLMVYNSARGAFHKRDVRLLESLRGGSGASVYARSRPPTVARPGRGADSLGARASRRGYSVAHGTGNANRSRATERCRRWLEPSSRNHPPARTSPQRDPGLS